MVRPALRMTPWLALIGIALLLMPQSIAAPQASRVDVFLAIVQATVRIHYIINYDDMLGDRVEHVIGGSGVLISGNRVLTCAHLVRGQMPGELVIYIAAEDKTHVRKAAKIIKADKEKDLMVLGFDEAVPVAPAPLAKGAPDIGDEIYVVGYTILPITTLRLGRYLPHAKNGILVSPVYHGDSGGGVYNQAGELIGIIKITLSVREHNVATPTLLGYATPLHVIREFLK